MLSDLRYQTGAHRAPVGSTLSRGKAITVQGVSKVFRGPSGSVEALKPLDLQIEAGQFVSVVGPSGCGKSTLLGLIAGLQTPTAGAIQIGAELVRGPYTEVGIVFQRDLLMEWRTALDNILLQVEMRGLRKRDFVDRALYLLDRVGLRDFADRYPRELSGGMRQRVSICRALIHEAPVLLMDEPFGALDALTRDDIAGDLARICEESGKTTLFITHSIAEAVFLSDRVVVMSGRPGRILDDIAIEMTRPRTTVARETAEFGRHVSRIRILLEEDKSHREGDIDVGH